MKVEFLVENEKTFYKAKKKEKLLLFEGVLRLLGYSTDNNDNHLGWVCSCSAIGSDKKVHRK